MRRNMVVRSMIECFGMKTKEGRCTSPRLPCLSKSFQKLREPPETLRQKVTWETRIAQGENFWTDQRKI